MSNPSVRMEKPSEAADAVEGTKEEGLSLGKDVEAKGVVSLLQGEAEKEFYVSPACFSSKHKDYLNVLSRI